MGDILTYYTSIKKHDLTILEDDFAEKLNREVIIADKGYVNVSKEFAEEMEKRGVIFIAIKRENMIKSEEEVEYYKNISKLRKKIETLFSVLDSFGLKFIKIVSRRGLVVKIILSLLAFNIYQLLG